MSLHTSPPFATATATAEPPPSLLKIEEVAEVLKCSVKSVRRLADRGAMPAPVRVGKLCRWARAALDLWIEGGCRPIRKVNGRARQTGE